MEDPASQSMEASGPIEDPPPPNSAVQDRSASESLLDSTADSGPSQRRPPPAPSPLTGCYLLIVIGEPHSERHKEIILQRISKGFLSWDVSECHVNLEKELQSITVQSPEGEEARYGERLIQYATENLVTEILIHPQLNTLHQCMKNLLSSFTKHRHIIHAGYTFAGNGSWILQDGTLSISDLVEALHESEVLRVLKAYENSVTIDVHCAPEGDWSTERFQKEPVSKLCKIRINPGDVMTAGDPAITAFIEYLSPFLEPANIQQLLQPTDVVGNIRFTHPTLYVFPGGQGDAALFGINGFNMLVDGGFSRKACFWDFARHLDRLDAVLLTRLNNSTVNGISAVLQRKKMNHVYPQIGHFFCNLQDRKIALSPDGDKDKDSLIVNLAEEGQEIVANLKHLALKPHPCYRDGNQVDPVNLYHKVGHGKLDMYVISPARDSQAVKEFLSKWTANDNQLFSNSGKKLSGKGFDFPIQNLVSICALLVWQPANPNDTITRILFPGSTPQHKIFEGLDKLRHLEFLKHPVCSARSISPSASVLTVARSLSRTRQAEEKPRARSVDNAHRESKPAADVRAKPKPAKLFKPPEKSVKQKPDTNKLSEENTESDKIAADPSLAAIKTIDDKIFEKDEKMESITKEIQKIQQENAVHRAETDARKVDKNDEDAEKQTKKVYHRSKYDMKNVKSKVDSRAPSKSIDRKKALEKKVENGGSPPGTPKKSLTNGTVNKMEKSRSLSRGKTSPGGTPGKSVKEANNRKVVEARVTPRTSKAPSKPKETPAAVAPPVALVKAERKPISRRPRAASPVKKAAPSASLAAKPKGVKSEAEAVIKRIRKAIPSDLGTDSTVSTPSADLEPTIAKSKSKEVTGEPPRDAQEAKTDLADTTEAEENKQVDESNSTENKETDEEAVREAEEGRSPKESVASIEIEIGRKEGEEEDGEEYLIVTKEEATKVEDAECDSTQEEVKTKDETEGEGEIKKIHRDEEDSEKKRKFLEMEGEQQQGAGDEKIDDRKEDASEQSPKSPDRKESKDMDQQKLTELDEGIDLREPVSKDHREGESLPDEKFSNTVETSATTAPTLPEDEKVEEPEREDKSHEKEDLQEKEVEVEKTKDDDEGKYVEEESQEESKEKQPRPEQPTSLAKIAMPSSAAPVEISHQRVHPRDLVKTPDEVADLPVHEEVDPGMYSSNEFNKDLPRKQSPEDEPKPDLKEMDKGEAKLLDEEEEEEVGDESEKRTESAEKDKGKDRSEGSEGADERDSKIKAEAEALTSKYLDIIDQLEKSAGQDKFVERAEEIIKPDSPSAVSPKLEVTGEEPSEGLPEVVPVTAVSTAENVEVAPADDQKPQAVDPRVESPQKLEESLPSADEKIPSVDEEKVAGEESAMKMEEPAVDVETQKDAREIAFEKRISPVSPVTVEEVISQEVVQTPEPPRDVPSGKSTPTTELKDDATQEKAETGKTVAVEEVADEESTKMFIESEKEMPKNDQVEVDVAYEKSTVVEEGQRPSVSPEPIAETDATEKGAPTSPTASGKITPAEDISAKEGTPSASGKGSPQLIQETTTDAGPDGECSGKESPERDLPAIVQTMESERSTPDIQVTEDKKGSGSSTPAVLDRKPSDGGSPAILEKVSPRSTPEISDAIASGKGTPVLGEKDTSGTATPDMSGTPSSLDKNISGKATPEMSGKATPCSSGKDVSGKATPEMSGKATPCSSGKDVSGRATPEMSGKATPCSSGKDVSGRATPESCEIAGTTSSSERGTPSLSDKVTEEEGLAKAAPAPEKEFTGSLSSGKESPIDPPTSPEVPVPARETAVGTPIKFEEASAAKDEIDDVSQIRRVSIEEREGSKVSSPIEDESPTKRTPKISDSCDVERNASEESPISSERDVSENITSVSSRGTPTSEEKMEPEELERQTPITSAAASPAPVGKETSVAVESHISETVPSGEATPKEEAAPSKASQPEISMPGDQLTAADAEIDRPLPQTASPTHSSGKGSPVVVGTSPSVGVAALPFGHRSLTNGFAVSEEGDELEKGILESEGQEKESQIADDISSGEDEELKALEHAEDAIDSESEEGITRERLQSLTRGERASKTPDSPSAPSEEREEPMVTMQSSPKGKKDDINNLVKSGMDSDNHAAVKRMLVTASSEDGGGETEICPQGSIRLGVAEVEVCREAASDTSEDEAKEEFGALISRAREEYNRQRSRVSSVNTPDPASSDEHEVDDDDIEESEQEEKDKEEFGSLLLQAKKEYDMQRAKRSSRSSPDEGDYKLDVSEAIVEKEETAAEDDSVVQADVTSRKTDTEADSAEDISNSRKEEETGSRKTSLCSTISQEDLVSRKDSSTRFEDFRSSSVEMSPLKTTYITSESADADALMTSSFYTVSGREEEVLEYRREKGYESFTEIGPDGEKTEKTYFYTADPDAMSSSTAFMRGIPEAIPEAPEMTFETFPTRDSFLPEDFSKAVDEHRSARGEHLGQPPEERTSQPGQEKVKDVLEGWGKPLGLPLPLKSARTAAILAGQNISTSSTLSTPSDNSDSVTNWGPPMNLPSPMPPAGQNGNPETPKKDKKTNQTKKGYLTDNRSSGYNTPNRRSESPVKQPERRALSMGRSKSGINFLYLDLTYVPHHGNSYYSNVEFFKRIRARYYVFSGTEPSKEVYNALLEAKQTWEDKDLEVTIIPTYDTDVLGYWVAENEEILAKNKIDLSPSASRCTINLQDHETSCSAYRLEF